MHSVTRNILRHGPYQLLQTKPVVARLGWYPLWRRPTGETFALYPWFVMEEDWGVFIPPPYDRPDWGMEYIYDPDSDTLIDVVELEEAQLPPRILRGVTPSDLKSAVGHLEARALEEIREYGKRHQYYLTGIEPTLEPDGTYTLRIFTIYTETEAAFQQLLQATTWWLLEMEIMGLPPVVQ